MIRFSKGRSQRTTEYNPIFPASKLSPEFKHAFSALYNRLGYYVRSSCSSSRKGVLVQTAQIMAVQALTWVSNSYQTPSARTQASTAGLSSLSCAGGGSSGGSLNLLCLRPQRSRDVFSPRLPNAASIPQYMSAAPVGMLRRGKLFHSSCLKGAKTGRCCINTPLCPNTAG
jgi:hypothetical protein